MAWDSITVTTVQAYTVACPLCGAEPGKNCVRVTDSNHPAWKGIKFLAGEPTRIPHNQRRQAYRVAHHIRAYPAQPNWRKPYRPSSAVQAVRAYELAELQGLADWLKNGGGHLLMAADELPNGGKVQILGPLMGMGKEPKP